MPTVSIDTFFACTVLVSVAIIATAFLASTMQTQIASTQDLNKQDYLQAIANRIVLGCGEPDDWGTQNILPSTLGLSVSEAAGLYVLDADKVSRLNSQNKYALSYFDILGAVHIDDLALSVSVAPIFSVHIALIDNVTVDGETTYNFTVSTNGEFGPLSTTLSCYLTANGILTHVDSLTSASGVGTVTFTLPDSAAGPAALTVFARSSVDERMTTSSIYTFGHLSALDADDPLRLAVLNSTLLADPIPTDITVSHVYALTYTYHTELTLSSTSNVTVPHYLDPSPTVLLVEGSKSGANFLQWLAYPQAPLTAGIDLSNSTSNLFTYTVTINGVFYRLTLSFGEVFK